MQELVELLLKLNLSISSSESFTGGLFASTITSIPGVSSVFKGSIIAYQNNIKENVLHIDKDIILKNGVISKTIALQMARNTQELFDSDICVSFTGNAGPNKLESKPIGLWFLGIMYKNVSYVYEFNSKGSREKIRKFAVRKASQIIVNIIRKHSYSNVL